MVAGTVLNTTTVVSDSIRPRGTKPSGSSQVAAPAVATMKPATTKTMPRLATAGRNGR
jgi:hypothetical protein